MNQIIENFKKILFYKKLKIILLMAVFAGFAYRLILIIDKYSVNILFWDQWDFYTGLFKGSSYWELFRWIHAPHRMGIGYFYIKILTYLSDWDSKWDSYGIVFILAIACVAAIYLKFRLFGKISYTDTVIPLIFLNLGQYEIFLITPNPSLNAIPLLLVILYAIALTINQRLFRNVTILVLNFIAIYTGFAIFLGLLTPVYFFIYLFKDGLRSKYYSIYYILFIILSLLSFYSFFVNYSFASAVDCFKFPHERPMEYFYFITHMLNNYLGNSDPDSFKFLLTIFFLSYMIFRIVYTNIEVLIRSYSENVKFKKSFSILLLLSFSALFALNSAIGRVCLGYEVASRSSRYIPFLTPFFLSIYFAILLTKQYILKYMILLIYIYLILSNEIFSLKRNLGGIENQFIRKNNWKECYLKYENITYCDSMHEPVYPVPGATDLQGKLNFLKEKKLNLFKIKN